MIVHVHQQRLRAGLPALILRSSRSGRHLGYHSRIDFEAGSVVQPGGQLSCGARAWIEVRDARCACPPGTHQDADEFSERTQ